MLTLGLWASAFAGIRAALSGYRPAHLALLRLLVASVILLFAAKPMNLRPASIRDVPAFFILGGLGFTAYSYALNIGETSVTAAAASLLVNTVPIFTTLLAWAFFRESLSSWGWLGLSIGFAGATLIALTSNNGFSLNTSALLV